MTHKKKVDVVPASEDALRAFFGSMQRPTMFALAATEDGEVAFIGGLFHVEPKRVVLFSDAITPDWISHHAMTVVKMTRRLLNLASHRGWTVLSYPDKHVPKAEQYLEHFGFVRIEDGDHPLEWRHDTNK